MNCAEFTRELERFVEGEISAEGLRPALPHAEACARCREEYEKTSALAGDLAACFQESAARRPRAARVMEDIRRFPQPRVAPVRAGRYFGVAAAVFLAALTGFVLFMRLTRPPGGGSLGKAPPARLTTPRGHETLLAEVVDPRFEPPALEAPPAPTGDPAALPPVDPGAEFAPIGVFLPPATFNGKLDRYLALATNAKVYFQTDRPLYRPGDVIWFKCWFVDPASFQERDFPFEVELVSPAGSVLASSPVVADQGYHPCFDLPEALPGGEHALRIRGQAEPERGRKVTVSVYQAPRYKTDLEFVRKSYAAGDLVEAVFGAARDTGEPLPGIELEIEAMVDGKPVLQKKEKAGAGGKRLISFRLPAAIEQGDGYLSVRVTEGGFSEAKVKTIPIAMNRIRFALYPESGSLVLGARNRVFFQGQTPGLKPADVEGDLLEDGKPVARIASARRGFGSFEFKPRRRAAYVVRITKPEGIKETFPLPAAEESAVNILLAENGADEIHLAVNANRAVKDFHLVETCRGERLHTYRGFLLPGENSIKVPVVRRMRGIHRLTLLDGDGVALAERLLFRDDGPRLDVRISADRPEYRPRDKVDLTVETLDENGKPVSARLALAVVNDAALNYADDKSSRIGARLYFEDEVKGEIFEPEWYLSGEEGSLETLDHLLNTQGWRRFEWREALGDPDGFIVAKIKQRMDEQDYEGAARIADLAFLSHPSYEKEIERVFPGLLARRAGWIVSAGELPVYEGNEVVGRLPKRSQVLVRGVARTREADWAYVQYAEGKGWKKGWVENGRLLAGRPGFGASASWVRDHFETAGGDFPADAGLALVPAEPAPFIDSVLRSGTKSGHAFDQNEPEKFKANRDLRTENLRIGKEFAQAPARDPGMEFPAERLRMFSKIQAIHEFQKAREGDKREEIGQEVFAYQARVFPALDYSGQPKPAIRTDFRDTIYWNPAVATDADGKARVTFSLSDAVTTFRASAEGIASDGKSGAAGRGDVVLASRLPFYAQAKVPSEVTSGDWIELPVAVRNDTDEPIEVTVAAKFGALLAVSGPAERKIALAPRESKTVFFDVEAGSGSGPQTVAIESSAQGLKDAFTTEIRVSPRGYPSAGAVSGVLSAASPARIDFPLPENVVPGTLECAARFYPSPLATMQDGVAGLLREPGGCFEQTTSTNYPNTIVVNYLREYGVEDPELYARASGLLDRGYGRLVAFECKERGFEWFGQGKGHEALTAFGLMQFKDMEKAGTKVDGALLDRTAEWLKGRVNTVFGYDQNPRFLHTWAVDAEMADCYITSALAEAGYRDLDRQCDRVIEVAGKRDDPYVLALAANSLLLTGYRKDAVEGFISRLAKTQEKDGSFKGKTQSVVCSTGINLDVETTGLSLLALVRAGRQGEAGEAAKWLNARRSAHGSYGSTQATVLALKSLAEFARFSRKPRNPGDIAASLNGAAAASLHFEADRSEPLILADLASKLRAGENRLDVTLAGAGELPYTLALTYRAVAPSTNAETAVKLSARLAKDAIKMGEAVSLEVTFENVSGKGLPMSLARIGYPGGLTFRGERLKELRDEGKFDFFETTGREIILYFTALEKGERRSFTLDLQGSVPGSYAAEAGSAYLYYTDDKKQWLEPLTIRIAKD